MFEMIRRKRVCKRRRRRRRLKSGETCGGEGKRVERAQKGGEKVSVRENE